MNLNILIRKQQHLQKFIKDELINNFEDYSSTYSCCDDTVLNLSKKHFDKWVRLKLHPEIVSIEGQFGRNSSYLHYLTIQYASIYNRIQNATLNNKADLSK